MYEPMNEGILNLRQVIEEYKTKELSRTTSLNKLVFDLGRKRYNLANKDRRLLDSSPFYKSSDEYLNNGIPLMIQNVDKQHLPYEL